MMSGIWREWRPEERHKALEQSKEGGGRTVEALAGRSVSSAAGDGIDVK